MSADNAEPRIGADLVAEAAAWLAVLHGPSRTMETERGFDQWLKRAPSHARAFEEATEIWEEARDLPGRGTYRTVPAKPRTRWLFSAGATVALATIVAAIIAGLYLHRTVISTDIGEQRILALEDGTQVTLNTATRIVVKYDRVARHVELESGEALFDVAKRPRWPFIVTAANYDVRALGTAFSVRRNLQQASITLIEGKVTVSEAGSMLPTLEPTQAVRRAGDAEVSRIDGQKGESITLVPGERLTFADHAPPRVDRPPLEEVLAWTSHEVALDDVPLSAAVAEMNRYSRKPLVIGGSQTAAIRVTGLFRAGDSLSFARAVAKAYALHVSVADEEILLSPPMPSRNTFPH